MTKRTILNKLWRDQKIIGKIYCQILRLNIGGCLNESEKETFFKHLKSLMHKLHAIKYHLANYRKIEKEFQFGAIEAIQINQNEVKEAFELIFELEAFFFQIKSSLDILTKLIPPILGNDCISTRTYKNKGDSIIKGLNQLKNNKSFESKEIEDMINLIRQDKDHWIQATIDWRDELSHYEGVKDFYFLPKKHKTKLYTVGKPEFKGRDVLQTMEMISQNNLNYSQEFISIALSIRMSKVFKLMRGSEEDAMKSFDNELPYAKYAVYYWTFKNHPVKEQT